MTLIKEGKCITLLMKGNRWGIFALYKHFIHAWGRLLYYKIVEK